jgi:hypothetical protein
MNAELRLVMACFKLDLVRWNAWVDGQYVGVVCGKDETDAGYEALDRVFVDDEPPPGIRVHVARYIG